MVSWAVEPSITEGWWMVMEYSDDNPNIATIVFDGTQSECEAYQRRMEN